MLKLSAAVTSCATAYAAFILQQNAEFEAGNVITNYSLCAALVLLTCTLIVLASPSWPKAALALGLFNAFVLVVGVAGAWAAWSIPAAAATDMLGSVVIVMVMPTLGILSVIAVILAIGKIAADLILLYRHDA